MMPGGHRNRWTHSSVNNGDSLDLDKPFRQSEQGDTASVLVGGVPFVKKGALALPITATIDRLPTPAERRGEIFRLVM
jgi:hypothetical protein